MRVLAIACGNTLRRDDGVAHHTLDLLSGVEKLAVPQLTIEMSEQIARFDTVVFLDADAEPGEPGISPLEASPESASLTHGCGAAEIVRLARTLYDFQGDAWLCRIPVDDFGYGEGLSGAARASSRKALEIIVRTLSLNPAD